MSIAPELTADCGLVTADGSSYGSNAETKRLQFGNPVSFRSVEVSISWHGNIVFLFDERRISHPQTVLHFTSESADNTARFEFHLYCYGAVEGVHVTKHGI